jgi:hypothetical protein
MAQSKNKGGRPFLSKGEKTVMIGYKDTEAHKKRITMAREKLGLESDSALIRLIVNKWLGEFQKTL